MWTLAHRRACDRRGLRYPSDLTDAEWALVRPLIRPAKRGGRPRSVDVREVVLNASFYVLSTGCQWTALPKDLPPRSTVWDYLDRWDRDGTLERIHHALYVEARERAGREASPTLAIIDAQSARGAQKGAPRSTRPATTQARRCSGASGMSLSIRSAGCWLLSVIIHPADVQDRDGAETVLRDARRLFPFIERLIADAGYQGPKVAAPVAKTGTWTLEIARRCGQHRFVVLPRRWIVERTLAWISRCRRLARDYERHARKAAAFIRLAMIRLMLRRIAVSPSC